MDPKVCGKLLTTHRRGYGVDVEALHGRFPHRRSTDECSKMDLTDIEGYGGGNCVSWCSWMFSGYIGIYRRKKYVGGRPRGPRDRGRTQGGGRALLSPGLLEGSLACNPSLPDHVRSKNNAPEGFIPFGLRFIFLFFETLK